MTDLIIDNYIEVETEHGLCKIELCFGSVTKVKQKVDVLVLSAFPGDYTPTATSVIGALKRDLQINVRDLAKNKEEDLRKLWSCWWSRELSEKLPFKRIMCFEGGFKKNTRPPSTISEVFRSLVSLCKNNNITVMMPVLASGNQGYSQQLMLRMIVEATIHWMRIGLPLKTMKLVVYCPNPKKPSEIALLLANTFKELNKNWKILKEPKAFSKTKVFDHDVYLAYSNNDDKVAGMVKQALLQLKKDAKIYSIQQEIDSEKSWQDHIYEVMVNSERVIALLSPNFLASAACVEKYNIGLCCSHNLGRDYLAPIYIEEVQQMPTYMGLIQYLDCRPVSFERITDACGTISSSLSVHLNDSPRKTLLKNKNKENMLSLDNQYDVFISYSHKDITIANNVVRQMLKLKPDWNIFIDQSGLRAGSSWQKKLYTSIENSKVVLALLSYNYMESKVCQEEYNLARSLHDDISYDTCVIDLKLEVIDMWPVWCTPYSCIDITDEIVSKGRSKQIINYIESIHVTRHDYTQSVINIKQRTSMWRKDFYKRDFPIIQNENFAEKHIFENFTYTTKSKYDIVLSYHKTDSNIAKKLCTRLKKYLPSLSISLPTNEKSHRLHDFDDAHIIVCLFSMAYVTANELMEEFQTALCRHRFEKKLILFPIILEDLPLFPVYPQIALCFFSMTDSFWYTGYKCIDTAAVVLCNILIKNPQVSTSFKTFMSLLELQEWSNYFVRDDKGESLDLYPIYFIGSSKISHKAFVDFSHEDTVMNHSSCTKTDGSDLTTFSKSVEDYSNMENVNKTPSPEKVPSETNIKKHSCDKNAENGTVNDQMSPTYSNYAQHNSNNAQHNSNNT